MKNSEVVRLILRELENNHLNLYHSISKEKVEECISSIRNIDELSCIQFDYEMLKLFACFKDAHTLYFVSYKYLDKQIIFIEDKLYLKNKQHYKEIVAVSNMPAKDFIQSLSQMQCFETNAHLKNCIRSAINNGYYYEMLGLAKNNSIIFEVIDDKTIKKYSVNIISKEEAIENGTIQNNQKFYEYKILGNILYFKYRVCREHKDYPFKDFVKEMKNAVKKYKLKEYILDLRDNNGGNSEILNPFQEFVKQNNLKGVLLINNGVFSSARIAVARFKKYFNVLLVGEETGGAIKSYGYNKNLQVENKRFCASTRLWDFSDIFGYQGSIQPDVIIEETIDDIKNNIDRQLDTAINLLNN